ncbi:Tryptophan synthase (indole-salvaging) [Candidatus Syntrophocurvum alkaliphilum]|uniref:Tryptophan synthase beta chain n=1 Tax=Candidatus Syntrophocurvum alkaliphilum TaxID=2293317 RepID=A0A6I6D752_9FIRM|nr:TrpB-like pyridoxal phosphate-dependent enzyme [Candidatus Syntrophocurvum alkaliphilum]QGT99006.1 Tryptophan synthase (indole-salvaging) [Candidatus Syntrophocurvum alkaliphilum]
MSREELTKIILPEEKLPKYWYNVQADMPNPLEPGLNPKTKEPLTPADLEPIFAKDLIEQEVSTERYIEIPDEIRELYKKWRPAPLFRAHGLEKALDTNCRIYYKYEGVSPVGSHKLNSALAQVYYNKKQGIKRITTETGAGQWGTALSLACQIFDVECMVYMVKVSFNQKPYRKSFMQMYGGKCVASPSELTESGRSILANNPDSPGTLAIAISEAVEDAASREDTNYSLGSVLNHVCLHQTIIGQEVKLQMEMIDEYPDVVIGAVGGGSNFAGIAFPFIPDKLAGKNVRLVGVEPSACPTLTKGVFAYDYGDVVGHTPMLKMYTLGHNYIPPGIHAGGLRYHGQSPLISQLYYDELLEAVAVRQNAVFEAAMLFSQTEGILPAPESSHAIRATIDEALRAQEEGVSKAIVFNVGGHGHLDLSAYDNYLTGKTEDVEFTDEILQKSLDSLPKV